MKLLLKQKVFAFRDKFDIKDEEGNIKYFAKGKFFSIGKRLHIFDKENNEIIFIKQRIFSFLPKFYIMQQENLIAEIVKKFTFFKPKFVVNGLNWEINGNFLAHDYKIYEEERLIASINKKWFSWGDCYEIDIIDEKDELLVLAISLVIDCVLFRYNH